MLICGQTEIIKPWVQDLIPHVDDFGPCEAIGVVENDKLIAGIVYHDFQPKFGTVQLSMAAINPRWAKKQNIKDLLSIPFEQFECQKIWTLTPIKNEKALKVNIHIGFTKEGVLRHQFGELGHGVVCGMLKKEYYKLFKRCNA